MSSGSDSSASAGLDVGRERLQNKNQYTYIGQTGNDSPLQDTAAQIADRLNQTRAEGNLAFGGPGYAGSFVSPNAKTASGQNNSKTFNPIGGAPSSMAGSGPPGPGGPPGGGGPPGPGGPPIVNPPVPPGPGIIPTGSPTGGVVTPGPIFNPQPRNGTGAPAGTGTSAAAPPVSNVTAKTKPAGLSAEDLAYLQSKIPGYHQLANGNYTWADRTGGNYGVQPAPGGGEDLGETAEMALWRANASRQGNLGTPGPGIGR